MIYLAKAIKNLRPEAEFSYSDDDYSTINWIVLEGDAPTQKEIDDEIKRIRNKEKSDAENRIVARNAILERLGLTEEEVRILLG